MSVVDFLLNFVPNENYLFLLYLLFSFFFSLFLIYIFYKKAQKTSKLSTKKNLDINDLCKIAKNKKSNIKDLLFAIKYFYQNFDIENNKKESFELFNLVLNHKNRKKILFNFFHDKILLKNLKYKKELDKLERKALNR